MNEMLNRLGTFAKYRVMNQNFFRQIKIVEKNLSLSKDALEALQFRKIKDLLIFAYANCPFYMEKYREAGVNPHEISNLKDFEEIPVITKEDIRQNIDTMIPGDVEPIDMERVNTGGTTGTPLTVFRDKRKSDLMNALFLRTIRAWGCDVGSKIVWLWGLPKSLAVRYDFLQQSRVRTFCRNVAWFDVFDMTKERMVLFTNFLRKFKPSLIIGYVSALSEYAEFLKRHDLHVPSPKAVCLTAEPSSDAQREEIENVFKTRSYDEYGSTEVLRIAAECRHRAGLHVHGDYRYVEITNSEYKSAAKGEYGCVVVTDLENKVMPLIRYVNGDVASWRQNGCSCGAKFPLMSAVAGRTYDMIKLSNGKMIYGHMFSKVLFNHTSEIRQFQVRQTAIDEVRICIVPGAIVDQRKLESIISCELNKYTDGLMHYSFEIVREIGREKSGKLRYVKCEI
jgi:phenylacetate-CoA ligase